MTMKVASKTRGIGTTKHGVWLKTPEKNLISAAKKEVRSVAGETIHEQGAGFPQRRLVPVSDGYQQGMRKLWIASTVPTSHSGKEGKPEIDDEVVLEA